jgi:hypothetical protein
MDGDHLQYRYLTVIKPVRKDENYPTLADAHPDLGVLRDRRRQSPPYPLPPGYALASGAQCGIESYLPIPKRIKHRFLIHDL